MDDSICWLVTILCEDQILKCATKIKMDLLSEDIIEYPMEPENREVIHNLLPSHVRSCGPIVDIEPLFGVSIVGESK